MHGARECGGLLSESAQQLSESHCNIKSIQKLFLVILYKVLNQCQDYCRVQLFSSDSDVVTFDRS